MPGTSRLLAGPLNVCLPAPDAVRCVAAIPRRAGPSPAVCRPFYPNIVEDTVHLMPICRRTSLCREGWYLLLLLAAVLTWALLRENNLLLLVAGLMSGTLLMDWRMSVAALRGLEVRRRIASGSRAGTWIKVEIEVRNGRRRWGSWALVVEDRLLRNSGVADERPLHPRRMFPYVPAGECLRQTYSVLLPHRGPYTLGPLCVSTRFPLGLVRHAVWLGGDDKLLVLPRLGHLRRAWMRHCPPAPYGARGARRPGYVPGDFFAVREWQAGDSVRWVHWRSTARHGQLVVRQFEQPGERQLAVLLDLWQPESPSLEQARRVELAVSFAATLVADFCRSRGPAVLVIAAAQSVCLAGRAAGAFSREAQISLALAQASPADPPIDLWEEALRRIGSQGELVVISTRPNVEAAMPALAGTAPEISNRRGTSVAGGLTSRIRERPDRRTHRILRLHDDDSALADYFEWERRAAEDAS